MKIEKQVTFKERDCDKCISGTNLTRKSYSESEWRSGNPDEAGGKRLYLEMKHTGAHTTTRRKIKKMTSWKLTNDAKTRCTHRKVEKRGRAQTVTHTHAGKYLPMRKLHVPMQAKVYQ